MTSSCCYILGIHFVDITFWMSRVWLMNQRCGSGPWRRTSIPRKVNERWRCQYIDIDSGSNQIPGQCLDHFLAKCRTFSTSLDQANALSYRKKRHWHFSWKLKCWTNKISTNTELHSKHLLVSACLLVLALLNHLFCLFIIKWWLVYIYDSGSREQLVYLCDSGSRKQAMEFEGTNYSLGGWSKKVWYHQ